MFGIYNFVCVIDLLTRVNDVRLVLELLYDSFVVLCGQDIRGQVLVHYEVVFLFNKYFLFYLSIDFTEQDYR